MNQLHETIASVAHKSTIAGSAGSVVAWFNSSEFGMWAGILIGLAGLVINWYFKRKTDTRNEEAHQAFMATLRDGNTLQHLDQLNTPEADA